MKTLSLIILLLHTCSYSLTLVYAPKSVCNHGSDNITKITGSDLKDNNATQSAQGALATPDWLKSFFCG